MPACRHLCKPDACTKLAPARQVEQRPQDGVCRRGSFCILFTTSRSSYRAKLLALWSQSQLSCSSDCRYFCGPDARKTSAQAKQEKRRPRDGKEAGEEASEEGDEEEAASTVSEEDDDSDEAPVKPGKKPAAKGELLQCTTHLYRWEKTQGSQGTGCPCEPRKGLTIVATAGTIVGTAGTIVGTAGTIVGTAGTIVGTAGTTSLASSLAETTARGSSCATAVRCLPTCFRLRTGSMICTQGWTTILQCIRSTL